METSAVPALIDAVIAAATTALPSVNVSDGVGSGGNSGDYLMVGVDDEGLGPKTAADSSQSWASVGARSRDEEGDVHCYAISWNGDANQKQARDAAYAITAAVETFLKLNPSLGVPQVLWTGFGSSTQLTQQQFDDGVLAAVVFSIHFRARL